MQPPNIDNVTIPGGIAIFFDEGAGDRHLGNLPADSVQIEPKSTELKVTSQLSGKERTAKIFSIMEECTIKAKLEEPVVQNMQAFFKGGVIEGAKFGAKDLETVASMPGKDQLRGMLIGLLQAPATKLVRLLATPGTQVARCISEKGKQA